jgi:hypothetical protein
MSEMQSAVGFSENGIKLCRAMRCDAVDVLRNPSDRTGVLSVSQPPAFHVCTLQRSWIKHQPLFYLSSPLSLQYGPSQPWLARLRHTNTSSIAVVRVALVDSLWPGISLGSWEPLCSTLSAEQILRAQATTAAYLPRCVVVHVRLSTPGWGWGWGMQRPTGAWLGD